MGRLPWRQFGVIRGDVIPLFSIQIVYYLPLVIDDHRQLLTRAKRRAGAGCRNHLVFVRANATQAP